MLKAILVLGAILVSPLAFGQSPDFTSFDDGHHGGGKKKMHRCIKKAWKASEPTAEQTTAAKGFMDDAKAVMEEHKAAIEAGKEAMKAAWAKHPVVQAEVIAAEETLTAEITPVKAAMRDAGINTLNLLSSEQRTKFDASFGTCIGDHF